MLNTLKDTATGINFRYLLSQAIVKKLWVRGYITEEEMKRIDERNKISFGFVESNLTNGIGRDGEGEKVG